MPKEIRGSRGKIIFEAVRSKGKLDSHDHCILGKKVHPVHL